MKNKFYGNYTQTNNSSKFDGIFENISIKGFHIEPSILSIEQCENLKKIIYRLNNFQNNKYGKNQLEIMGEENLIRLPLIRDRIFFQEIIMNDFLQCVLKKLFKPTNSYYILNQQNIVINTPQKAHSQSLWHRDFPYLNGILSIPAAFSAIFCLDNFTKLNGATKIIPHTHKNEKFPSRDYIENHYLEIEAHQGTLVMLNSQLFHCAGYNKSDENRIAINNIFSNPIFMQQINIPDAINISGINWPKDLGRREREILGYYSNPAKSDDEFKTIRLNKLKLKN